MVRGFLRVTDGEGSTTRDGLTQNYNSVMVTQAVERGVALIAMCVKDLEKILEDVTTL